MEHSIPSVDGARLLLGNSLQFSKNPGEFLRDAHRKYGDIFKFKMMGKNIVTICSPEYNRILFEHTDGELSIRESYPSFAKMFSDNFFFFAPHDQYVEQREMVKTLFKVDSLRSYVSKLRREARLLIESLEGSGELELSTTLGRLTANFNASVFLGPDFREMISDDIYKLYNEFSGGLELVLPTWLPLKHIRRSQTAKRTLTDLMLSFRAKKLRNDVDESDPFVRIHRELEKSRYGGDDEMIALVLLLLGWAGQETGAGSMMWAIVNLLLHKDVQRKLLDEIVDAKTAHNIDELNWDVIQSMKYLDAVILESERRHPVINILMRTAKRDIRFGPHLVKRGTTIFAAPAVTHLRSDLFEHPYAFRPERFLDSESGAPPVPPYLIGFSGGAHRCAGVNFARLFIKVAVVSLVQELDLELVDEPVYKGRGGANVPSAPLRVRYRRRHGKA
ncbi:cytochrome P450 [Pseudomonas sp. D(2018)]|uniref:cytochrome P450 n=1 Tax=Pseudomonas sp. D(2018) TaxID=2502238 RepID=UPI0010F4A7FB|nr:cytochrome P450 [Pseudomonas sp. D(2018)]